MQISIIFKYIRQRRKYMEVKKEPQRYYFLLKIMTIQNQIKKPKRKIIYDRNIAIKFLLQNARNLGERSFSKQSLWIEAQIINNQIKYQRQVLQFVLINSLQEQQNTALLKVLLKRKKKQLYYTEPNESILQQDSHDEAIQQLGQCQINLAIYTELFNQCNKNSFQEKMEISRSYNIQYEIFIQKTKKKLDSLVKSQKRQNNFIDQAFKKRPSNKNIRFVQINNDRQISIKEEQFRNTTNQLKISSLKKQGNKYVPYKMVHQDYNKKYNQKSQNNKQLARHNIHFKYNQSLIKGKKPQQIRNIYNQIEVKMNKQNNDDEESMNKDKENNIKLKVQNKRLSICKLFFFIIFVLIVYYMMLPSKKL